MTWIRYEMRIKQWLALAGWESAAGGKTAALKKEMAHLRTYQQAGSGMGGACGQEPWQWLEEVRLLDGLPLLWAYWAV